MKKEETPVTKNGNRNCSLFKCRVGYFRHILCNNPEQTTIWKSDVKGTTGLYIFLMTLKDILYSFLKSLVYFLKDDHEIYLVH